MKGKVKVKKRFQGQCQVTWATPIWGTSVPSDNIQYALDSINTVHPDMCE